MVESEDSIYIIETKSKRDKDFYEIKKSANVKDLERIAKDVVMEELL